MLFVIFIAGAVSCASAQQGGSFETEHVSSYGSTGLGDGQFKTPQGVTTDQSGNIYVADLNNNRIEKFDSSGNFISKFGSYGSGDGLFHAPTSVAVDKFGNIYVVDIGNYRVEKFDSSGNFISKFGTQGSDNGQFMSPQGIAIDSSGNIYVVDLQNLIQKFDSSGNFISKIGAPGTGTGQLNSPVDLAFDNSGNMYVTNSGNSNIVELSGNGAFVKQWGSYCPFNNPSLSIGNCVDPDGPGPLVLGDGQFNDPNGIAVDGLGNVYVADMDNNRVEIFDSSGHFIDKFGSFGSNSSQFADPSGITVSNSGNVHVADMNNNRVQIFHADYNGASVSQNNYAWSGNYANANNSQPSTASTNTTSNTNPDTTSITITPNTLKALEGSVVHYTVTVTDTSTKPTSPSGIVSWFAKTNVGQFNPDSCSLVPNDTNSAESNCTVNYTVPDYCSCSVTGMPVTVVGSYQGDSLHQISSASANIIGIGLYNATVYVVANETQVTAGSPVKVTVTVTNDSDSPVAVPVAPNTLQNVVYLNDSYIIGPNNYNPGKGTFSPDTCALSANPCIFTYTPAIDYQGNVLLTGAYWGKYQTGGLYNVYDFGTTTLQVNKFAGTLPSSPSYANKIMAQNGSFTVTFVSSFGSSGYEDGQMATPQGIALDQSGNIYVAELNSKRVDKFDSSGHLLSKIGVGILTSPTNVAVDKSGNVYVVDISSDAVYKFDMSGNFLSKFQPFGKCDLGNRTKNNMEPQGIALDSSGNVYITDLCDVQKYDSNGNPMLTFGTFGNYDGQFTGTGDITVDKSGYIYVADSNERIQKFNPAGVYVSQFGTPGHLEGQFKNVQAVAFDKSGNMWITDMDNNRIEVFDPSGKFLFTFGTLGSNPGQFNDPNDIMIDSSGNMYVSDMNNGRVQVFHIEYDTDISSVSSQSTSSPQDASSQSVAELQPATQTTPAQSVSTQTTQIISSQSRIQLNTVPALSSLSKSPGWVKDIFIFRDKGEISGTDLLNAINFLIQQDVVKLN